MKPPTADELRQEGLKEGAEGVWWAVYDYIDGWAWPTTTFEDRAALIASFFEEDDDGQRN